MTNIPSYSSVKERVDSHVDSTKAYHAGKVIDVLVTCLADNQINNYTSAFGRIEICKRLDFLNTFGNKHIEAVASIVNQTFNQKGWKSPVKIYFDDEGDAFVKFSQDF